jgi:hypothetical protein
MLIYGVIPRGNIMGNTQPIKGGGSTPPTTPRTDGKATVNFEAVALGQATGVLPEHDKLALEQLHSSQPKSAAAYEQLKDRHGRTKGSKCIVNGLDPDGPIEAAFRHSLKELHGIKVKFSIGKDGTVTLVSNVSKEILATALEREFNLINNLRKFNSDERTMASLLFSKLDLPPCLRNSVDPFKISPSEMRQIIAMIDHGFYDLSAHLLDSFASDPDFKYCIGIKNLDNVCGSLDGFRNSLTQRGIDVDRYSLQGKGYSRTCDLVKDFKVLLCIDLCTRKPSDPLQAARIVMNHISENAEALPYQDKVMAALIDVVRTPDEAKSLVQILTEKLPKTTTVATSWLKPLTTYEDKVAFGESYTKLMESGKVKVSGIIKGRGDLFEIIDLDPVGKMDTRTISLLIKVVKSGMSLVNEMGEVLGAFTLLARITLEEGSSDLRKAVEKLGRELVQKVFDNEDFNRFACDHVVERTGEHIWHRGRARVDNGTPGILPVADPQPDLDHPVEPTS